MKKIIAGIVLALMVVALPIGMVGCKGSNKKSTIYGTWEFSGEFKYVGVSAEYAAAHLEFNSGVYTKDNMTKYTFNEDFNGNMTIAFQDGAAILEAKTNFTWAVSSLDSKKIILTIVGDDVEGTYQRELVYENDAIYMAVSEGDLDEELGTQYTIYAVYKK